MKLFSNDVVVLIITLGCGNVEIFARAFSGYLETVKETFYFMGA